MNLQILAGIAQTIHWADYQTQEQYRVKFLSYSSYLATQKLKQKTAMQFEEFLRTPISEEGKKIAEKDYPKPESVVDDVWKALIPYDTSEYFKYNALQIIGDYIEDDYNDTIQLAKRLATITHSFQGKTQVSFDMVKMIEVVNNSALLIILNHVTGNKDKRNRAWLNVKKIFLFEFHITHTPRFKKGFSIVTMQNLISGSDSSKKTLIIDEQKPDIATRLRNLLKMFYIPGSYDAASNEKICIEVL